MKVLICGSWETQKAGIFARESRELGKRLAEAGHEVILGSGSGVAGLVMEGFNSVASHGKSIFYLPDLKEMKRVGEEMGDGADLVVQTNADYPTRNLIQLRVCDALAVVGGADATVSEVINAILDYQKPVVILEKSGPVSAIVKMLPKTGNKVYFAKNIKSMVDFLNLMQAAPKKVPPVGVHTA